MIQKIRKQFTFMFRDKNNRQKGFTLVELAIAMGIIGLLVGGVLKGRAMIENARVKALYKECTSYEAAVYSFQDAYSDALPGDENISNQPPGDGTDPGTAGDGIVQATESAEFFSDLVLAGFTTQRPLDGSLNPGHTYSGGIITVETSNNAIPSGQTALWLRFSNIPVSAVMTLDSKYDDGVGDTGNDSGAIQCSVVYSSCGDPAGTPSIMFYRL